MNITEKKIVTNDFMYRDSHYTLFYFPQVKKYGAIDHKYIKDGKLTRELNGLQLFLHDRLSITIQAVKNMEDVNFYTGNGYTKYQALCEVFGLEYKPENEVLFK